MKTYYCNGCHNDFDMMDEDLFPECPWCYSLDTFLMIDDEDEEKPKESDDYGDDDYDYDRDDYDLDDYEKDDYDDFSDDY